MTSSNLSQKFLKIVWFLFLTRLGPLHIIILPLQGIEPRPPSRSPVVVYQKSKEHKFHINLYSAYLFFLTEVSIERPCLSVCEFIYSCFKCRHFFTAAKRNPSVSLQTERLSHSIETYMGNNERVKC